MLRRGHVHACSGAIVRGVTGETSVALATRGLAKRYGDRTALDGLDLSVPSGTVYGFLGPNGAGKTTTMRIVTGLIRPDAGEVELLGRPFRRADRRRLFDVGCLIETPSFYPFLSGRENLRALAATGRPVPKGRIEELLALVGLTVRARDKVSGYSLGMKQRLGIAAALLGDPKLLLLDEPANGLDPAGIVGMRDTLRSLAAAGTTVLVSSHILSEVQQLVDVVGIIDRGKLVREGRIAELLATRASLRLQVRPSDKERATGIVEGLIGDGSVDAGTAGDGWLIVKTDPARGGEINRALAGADIFASRIEVAANLEDLFLGLTSNLANGSRASTAGSTSAAEWSA